MGATLQQHQLRSCGEIELEVTGRAELGQDMECQHRAARWGDRIHPSPKGASAEQATGGLIRCRQPVHLEKAVSRLVIWGLVVL